MTEKRFTQNMTHYGTSRNYVIGINDNQTNRELVDIANVVELLNMLHEENQHFKRLAYGNEEQLLKVMSYLHDKYYDLWEEVNKECYNG